MDSTYLSERLQNYLAHQGSGEAASPPQWVQGTLEVVGQFLYGLVIPPTWHLREIERVAGGALVWYWVSTTDQAVCPTCRTLSASPTHTYKVRRLQDLPCAGLTVYHVVKTQRYRCEESECPVETFVEQFESMAGKDARLTHRLKDFLIYQSLDTSANGLPASLQSLGIRVSRDTILRLVKALGATVVEQNLERDDVRVLSVDDVNLRKGQASTACSVFIDGETHRVLVIVQGASQTIATKVMCQFPTAEIVSRDRGSAYAAAAQAAGTLQVADGFHLVQNLHEAIKESLYQTLGSDVFVREGSGWIRMVNGIEEAPEPASPEGSADDTHVAMVGPALLTEADQEQRIHLAGLTARQAAKYRRALRVLELTESGLRTADIAQRLSCTRAEVRQSRKQAPDLIQQVEQRIDDYYQRQRAGQWESYQKTIAPHARPSSESIVEPYRDTVLRLFQEGKTHRDIHPVIVQEGFTGSANAVYQYLIKYAKEHAIPYGRDQRIIPTDERTPEGAPPRPAPIAIERVSTTTIYRRILHLAASRRATMDPSQTGWEPPDSGSPSEPEPAVTAWENHTQYADRIAEIVYDTRPPAEKPAQKKLSDAAWTHLLTGSTGLQSLVTCLVMFYDRLLSGNVIALDQFIARYGEDSREPLASFASGLRTDYDAVRNGLLYPDISNGPMEATNPKIKMVRRRSYGRAGLELLNALLVLPWYYRDRQPTPPPQAGAKAA